MPVCEQSKGFTVPRLPLHQDLPKCWWKSLLVVCWSFLSRKGYNLWGATGETSGDHHHPQNQSAKRSSPEWEREPGKKPHPFSQSMTMPCRYVPIGLCYVSHKCYCNVLWGTSVVYFISSFQDTATDPSIIHHQCLQQPLAVSSSVLPLAKKDLRVVQQTLHYFEGSSTKSPSRDQSRAGHYWLWASTSTSHTVVLPRDTGQGLLLPLYTNSVDEGAGTGTPGRIQRKRGSPVIHSQNNCTSLRAQGVCACGFQKHLPRNPCCWWDSELCHMIWGDMAEWAPSTTGLVLFQFWWPTHQQPPGRVPKKGCLQTFT